MFLSLSFISTVPMRSGTWSSAGVTGAVNAGAAKKELHKWMIHIGGQKIVLPTCTGRERESNSEARGGTERERRSEARCFCSELICSSSSSGGREQLGESERREASCRPQDNNGI